ncbi:hypothetical protein ElyMa_003322300 [Elysia marginata]|uniref:Reverse transcriptase domain-containing protein n=1 Tax=Elysia marginata TaxID=1093978 RepID=A0AAV4JGE7_9GAST|nr:hypothetical protein ElyMa_003322300 [Elysia marginata]
MGTVRHADSASESDPFPIRKGAKQGCVLGRLLRLLLRIFLSLLLHYAFHESEYCTCLHIRKDGKLFNLSHLRAKTKVYSALIGEMLFADDAALTRHSEEAFQLLISCFSGACREFYVTISLEKKTNIMGQYVDTTPQTTIDEQT